MGTEDRRGKRVGVVAIVALALFTLGYEALRHGGLMETSAFFVGLPALLAIVVVVGTSPLSAVGIVTKTLVVALLLSTFVLQACVVCMLFAAPLFFVVALAVVGLARLVQRLVRRGGAPLSVVALPFALLSAPLLAGSPHQHVTVTRVVAAPAAAVEAALAGPPVFARPRPFLLHRVGYRAAGAGLERGDRRTVTIGVPGEGHGTLVLVVARRAPGIVVFRAASDSSPVAQWLRLRTATVRWRPLDAGHAQVSWRLAFDRRVEPGWYFGPLLDFEARIAAGYLIDTVATPR